MLKLDIVYRCCELETGNKPKRSCRPLWFSKEKSLINLLEEFKFKKNSTDCEVRFHAIHDGPIGPLHAILSDYNCINIDKVAFNSNEKSLETCLSYASGLPTTDYIYFIEDDYFHRSNSLEALIEGLSINPLVSLYDHPDRYTRTDDIDFCKTQLFLGQRNYWRTAESTTCSWATTQDKYLECVYEQASKFKLNDRELFRALIKENNIRLIAPMKGLSTHCHHPFLSPFLDWAAIASKEDNG